MYNTTSNFPLKSFIIQCMCTGMCITLLRHHTPVTCCCGYSLVCPPSLLLLPPPQLHVVITASWSITPSPWVTDCWNCFLVWFPFSPSYLLLKYFFGPLPLVTHCWNCFLNTFPQLPVSCPPPQLPAVGTVSYFITPPH